MGQTISLNKVAQLKGIDRNLLKLSTEISDAYVAMAHVVFKLREGLDKKLRLVFNEDEEAQWVELEKRKVELITGIDDFARGCRVRYEVAREFIARETTTHEEKVRAAQVLFSDADVDGKIGSFVKDINNLKEDYKTFHNKLQKRGADDKAAAKLAVGVGAVVGGVWIVGLFIAHLIPGVNVVMTAGEVAFFGAALVAAAVTASVALSQDEVQRAMAYLDNIEERLKDLRTSMKELRDDHQKGRLNEKYPEHCVVVLEDLIHRCDQVISAAERV